MTISVRKWNIEDASDLAVFMNNKKLQDNLRDGIPFPYGKNDARLHLEQILGFQDQRAYHWAVTAEGRAIGSISFSRGENIHRRTAELGYCLSEEFWGKGIATKAIKLCCTSLFEETDILRIFAEPFADNLASCRVLEKLGFTFEGCLKKNAVKNNKILDMNLYALLKD